MDVAGAAPDPGAVGNTDGGATLIDVTVGNGSTADGDVTSTAATGSGSIADRMPSQDSPTATAVTIAQAARYPIDRLIATSLP